MKINILLADTYGFCFGVKRAVELTEETLAKEKSVYIDGMLIHNEDEVSRLAKLGLKELDRKSVV